MVFFFGGGGGGGGGSIGFSFILILGSIFFIQDYSMLNVDIAGIIKALSTRHLQL